jgi:hypothetical protein
MPGHRMIQTFRLESTNVLTGRTTTFISWCLLAIIYFIIISGTIAWKGSSDVDFLGTSASGGTESVTVKIIHLIVPLPKIAGLVPGPQARWVSLWGARVMYYMDVKHIGGDSSDGSETDDPTRSTHSVLKVHHSLLHRPHILTQFQGFTTALTSTQVTPTPSSVAHQLPSQDGKLQWLIHLATESLTPHVSDKRSSSYRIHSHPCFPHYSPCHHRSHHYVRICCIPCILLQCPL